MDVSERQAYVEAQLAAAGFVPSGVFCGTRHPRRGRRRSSLCAAGCGNRRDRPGQAYCKECHAAYARATRPKHSELDPETKRRLNCRRYTAMLVSRGKLTKTPCACGATDVSAVHHDWNNPRDVTWRCARCRKNQTVQTAAA